MTKVKPRRSPLKRALLLVAFAALMLPAGTSIAGPRETARTIHNRVAGVPADEATMAKLTALVAEKKYAEAAMLAMEAPSFYNLTLRNWVATWTNREVSPREPLNDYAATVIGMIRDDLPFDQALYEDIIYVGRGNSSSAPFAPTDNNHYLQMQLNRVDLKAALERRVQSDLTLIPPAATAGVLTTRNFAASYFSAGTNRRAAKYAFLTFLCHEMEELADTTRSERRIRRDVSRSPGGNSALFKSKCAGCHAGMDALAGAFAQFDFAGNRLVYTPGVVNPKMNINETNYPDGYPTTDDSWENLWVEGPNAKIGWHGAVSGKGVKEFGIMLSKTDEFPRCMATRVFKKVCLRTPKEDKDKALIDELASAFKAEGRYSMKSLFANTAAKCLAEDSE